MTGARAALCAAWLAWSATALAQAPAATPAAGSEPPPTARVADLEAEPIHVLPPIDVLGEGAGAYTTSEPTTASRIPLQVMEVPKAVQVVPEAVIEDQQAVVPNEITRNVSAVRQSGAWYGNDETYIIRGFVQQNAFKDGIRSVPVDGFSDQPASTDVANLDRVEVIKGPASILFGRVEPGGIVNYVTKKPLFTPSYTLRQRFGSYDFYRTEVDLTGPVAGSDQLAYRLIGVYQSTDTFVPFTGGERGFGSGSLLWRSPDRRTQARLRLDFLYDDFIGGVGLPIVGGAAQGDPTTSARLLPGVRYNQYLGEPDVSGRNSKVFESFLEVDHEVTDWFQLTLRGAYQPAWVTNHDIELGPYYLTNPPFFDGSTLARSLYDGSFDTFNATVQLWGVTDYDVPNADVDWLDGIEGTLVTGVEWQRRDADGERLLADFSRIDPFNPVYTGRQIGALPSKEFSDFDVEETALVVENSLAWRDYAVLLAGVRVGYLEVHSVWDYTIGPSPRFTLWNAHSYEVPVTPFAGLLGRPLPEVSVYGSYSQSFQPPDIARDTAGGNPVEPETGDQWEGGVKWEPLGDRLLATATGFLIKKQNVVSPDPIDPGFFINLGEIQSHGVEVDIAGTLLPGWRVIASYAYIDASVASDVFLDGENVEGNRLFGVPANSGSLWTTYQLSEGLLAGLGGGFGIFASGDVENDNLNTLTLPAWTELDAALFYVRDHFEVRLNFKNLASEQAFLAQGNVYRAIPISPLTVLGSIAWRF